MFKVHIPILVYAWIGIFKEENFTKKLEQKIS